MTCQGQALSAAIMPDTTFPAFACCFTLPISPALPHALKSVKTKLDFSLQARYLKIFSAREKLVTEVINKSIISRFKTILIKIFRLIAFL